MRAWILIAALAACGDNLPARHDAGPSDTASPDGNQALKHCLDHPTNLVKPPNGQLPCELLPPGFEQ
jgi:hypothetical protein